MSLTLLSWFRQKISGSEEFVSKETFDIYITEAHSELLRKGGIDVEKSKLERNILRVKRRAAEIQPTMQRIVTPTVRVALLELIVKCEEEKVHVTNKSLESLPGRESIGEQQQCICFIENAFISTV